MHLSATKTLPSGEAARLHTRLNTLGLEPFSTVIKDHSTLPFATASTMTAPSGYTSVSGEYPRFAYIKIYRKDTTK